MAILKLYQITWLLQSLIAIFSLENIQAFETETDRIQVKLKNCCFNEVGSSTNCDKDITLDWNYLRSFRIPRTDNTTSIILDSTLADDDKISSSLECDSRSTNQFIIPSFDHETFNKSHKGFFAFFSKDGHFQYNENIFDSTEFCIQRQEPTISEDDETSSEAIIVSVCTSRESECSSANFLKKNTKNCVVRCCSYGEAYMYNAPIRKFQCVDSGENKWKPKIYTDLNSDVEVSVENEEQRRAELPLTMVVHARDLYKKFCKETPSFQSFHVKQHANEATRGAVGDKIFKILKDGSVWIKIRRREWAQLLPGEYCIDGFQHGQGNYSGDNSDSLLFECKKYDTQVEMEGRQRQRKYSLVFGILLVFCLCFLLMTIVVYVLLWSKHNYHGFTVFCYILALFATYLSLGISHFLSISSVRGTDAGIRTFCGLIGIICHFTFLSVFSWSTVLNFDLWCTFRNLRPSNRKSRGVKRFLAYAFFALAIPVIIVTTGILLDLAYGDDARSDLITPQYGKAVCFVEPRHARFYFVVLPIAVLLGTNFVLFCNTAISVYKVKQSTRFASSSSTKNEASNQTFRLILKLMLVNGTIWIVEIISWYLQTGYEEVGLPAFILDVINILQAVAIFFLFVFKNDILEALKRGYPKLEGVVGLAYKIKNFGRSGHQAEHAPSSMDTSCNSKPTENVHTSNL